jgi:hypothetical protein
MGSRVSARDRPVMRCISACQYRVVTDAKVEDFGVRYYLRGQLQYRVED